MRLPSFQTVLNGIHIIGSIAGTQVDMAEVFQLHARGRTHVTDQRRPLESPNRSFADILAGRISARIVVDSWVGDDHPVSPTQTWVPARAGSRCSTRPPGVLARTPGLPSPGHRGGLAGLNPRPSLSSSTT
jgi:hypothetical protein